MGGRGDGSGGEGELKREMTSLHSRNKPKFPISSGEISM